MVRHVAGKANIDFFKYISPIPVNGSTAFTDYGLTQTYQVSVDGRAISAPSRGIWKIQAGVPHTIETSGGPNYAGLFAMVTTDKEQQRAIVPCVPEETPEGVGDDYIDAHNYYYDTWTELTSCPIESSFRTNGYTRRNYFFNDSIPFEQYQDNNTCTVFQTDVTSKVSLDLTVYLGSLTTEDFSLVTSVLYAYGNVTLQSVPSCQPLLGTCTASAQCCLGYACIKNRATAPSGTCRECKSLGATCVSADACCNGLKCGAAKKCVAA